MVVSLANKQINKLIIDLKEGSKEPNKILSFKKNNNGEVEEDPLMVRDGLSGESS